MSAAIVTGAGGAIGRAVASRLAREGRPVLLVDRAEPVASVRDELRERGATAEACVVDLADPTAPLAVRDAVDRLGGASVLAACSSPGSANARPASPRPLAITIAVPNGEG